VSGIQAITPEAPGTQVKGTAGPGPKPKPAAPANKNLFLYIYLMNNFVKQKTGQNKGH
jgi:hypothetical protein